VEKAMSQMESSDYVRLSDYRGEIKGFRMESGTTSISMDDPTAKRDPYYPPAETEFISAMRGIAVRWGKLADNDGNGIWTGYTGRKQNDNYDKGIRCENCAHYESEKVCAIIKREIEPGGYCRLAAIPMERVSKE
jgi:hypothetical protein